MHEIAIPDLKTYGFAAIIAFTLLAAFWFVLRWLLTSLEKKDQIIQAMHVAQATIIADSMKVIEKNTASNEGLRLSTEGLRQSTDKLCSEIRELTLSQARFMESIRKD